MCSDIRANAGDTPKELTLIPPFKTGSQNGLVAARRAAGGGCPPATYIFYLLSDATTSQQEVKNSQRGPTHRSTYWPRRAPISSIVSRRSFWKRREAVFVFGRRVEGRKRGRGRCVSVLDFWVSCVGIGSAIALVGSKSWRYKHKR